jgi:hypothetical protein
LNAISKSTFYIVISGSPDTWLSKPRLCTLS